MIYEMITIFLRPGRVQPYMDKFGENLRIREKHSKLGGFWRADIGPLNQVIQIWPYEDLQERERVQVALSKDSNWPPSFDPNIFVSERSEIYVPAPFMRPMGGDQALGGIYEMRSYLYESGNMPEIIRLWGEAMPHREKISPLAAAMYTEIGGLDKWVHIWPYKDPADREDVRIRTRESTHWPPPTGDYLVQQDTTILVPSHFSPMH